MGGTNAAELLVRSDQAGGKYYIYLFLLVIYNWIPDYGTRG